MPRWNKIMNMKKEEERSTMAEKVIENNKVSVIGEIISGFTFSHEVFGEGFIEY